MNEKIENILNLSIMADNEIKNKSRELQIGYDFKDKTWDLILRYRGEGEFLFEYDTNAKILSGGYAIVNVNENRIDELASREQVLFIEKPKALFYEVTNGIRVSCITPIQNNYGLFGEGTIAGIIDSGIDYYNDAFLDENGETRIVEIWDQTKTVRKPENSFMGVGEIFGREQINESIFENNRDNAIVNDSSGHGTHVAGIVAGNFASDKRNNVGIATQSEIIVVKLDDFKNGFPRTTELMLAIEYLANRAEYYNKPMAVNISFGNNYGSHDGTSLLETYIDYMCDREGISIVVGSGNEGDASGHTFISVTRGESITSEFSVGDFEKSLGLQMWKNYVDDISLKIITPEFNTVSIPNVKNEALNLKAGKHVFFIYFGTPKPYSRFQEIYVDITSEDDYLTHGIWQLEITGINIVQGNIDIWMNSSALLNAVTGFLNPSPDTTLTIPSTSNKVITVGAYNTLTDTVAAFSGRGYTREINMVKPDLVAPGVGVVSAAANGTIEERTGTSMATPFVTGSALLLMEWGIVKGNDMFMYGEKVKATLLKGARKLNAYEQYPNKSAGYGALCLNRSLSEI